MAAAAGSSPMTSPMTSPHDEPIDNVRQRVAFDSKGEIGGRAMLDEKIDYLIKTGESPVFDNQYNAASNLATKFCEFGSKILVGLLLALTQSGKTGCMLSFIHIMVKRYSIPIEHIYIMTGVSSCDWVEQTKSRFPRSLRDNIYHLPDLPELEKEITGKKNVLLIIDEVHVAAKQDQSVSKVLKAIGFDDHRKMLENDIKVVQVSATPNGCGIDLNKWGVHSTIEFMEPGRGYTSCFDLVRQGRVFEAKDLACYNKKTGVVNEVEALRNISELKRQIQRRYNNSKRYHIIRTPSGKIQDIVIKNFKKVFGRGIKCIKYNQSNTSSVDIKEFLKCEPCEHTFIFIKETLRCAITLPKRYLGVLYDRIAKIADDSVVTQGLLGRLTGYRVNRDSIVYTHMASIEKYRSLIELYQLGGHPNPFWDDYGWKSNTTTSKKVAGVIVPVSKGTHTSAPKSLTGPPPPPEFTVGSIGFDTLVACLEASKEYNNGAPYGFSMRQNDAGFYMSTLGAVPLRERSIHHTTHWDSYIATNPTSNYGRGKDTLLPGESMCRIHPIYRDLSDPTSVIFYLRWITRRGDSTSSPGAATGGG